MPDRMLKQIFLSICELTAVSQMKNNGFLNELLFGPFFATLSFKSSHSCRWMSSICTDYR